MDQPMLAFVFPGQGSQTPGMGGALFDEVVEYRTLERDVDAIVGYSLRELCLHDRGNRLSQTQYTQPCLYVVNALTYYKARSAGLRPRYLAGHSLGEYSALLAAGAFDFLSGLRLVCERGSLMAQEKGGAMAAVAGLDAKTIARLIDSAGFKHLHIATFNSPTQTVIAGCAAEIHAVAPVLNSAGATLYLPLAVSGAFHTPRMANAARRFAAFLEHVSISPLTTPVIANATAQPYPMEAGPDVIKDLLVRQMTEAVQWTDTIRWLQRQGVSEFQEMGPGTVLTRLIQRNLANDRPPGCSRSF